MPVLLAYYCHIAKGVLSWIRQVSTLFCLLERLVL
jgi:hypothetical protein